MGAHPDSCSIRRVGDRSQSQSQSQSLSLKVALDNFNSRISLSEFRNFGILELRNFGTSEARLRIVGQLLRGLTGRKDMGFN